MIHMHIRVCDALLSNTSILSEVSSTRMAMVQNIFPKCPDQKCIKRKNNNTCRTQRSGLPDQWQQHDLVTC